MLRGTANHAGTTPMHLRRDALTAAATWIVETERYAQQTADVVATVGSMAVSPGARNVISGEVRCSLDVRSAVDASREAATDALLAHARQIGKARGIAVTTETHLQQTAVPMDTALTSLLEQAMSAEEFAVRTGLCSSACTSSGRPVAVITGSATSRFAASMPVKPSQPGYTRKHFHPGTPAFASGSRCC